VSTRRHASLKPQLNQIRDWVAAGATDIWIAHQLGSTPASIAAFRRQHGLLRERPGDDAAPEPAGAAAERPAAVVPAADRPPRRRRAAPPALQAAAPAPEPTAEEPAEAGEAGARKRRSRRGGRGRRTGGEAPPLELEAVFDHGEEGYGLWLDGAVRDAPVYRRHWLGHAAVVVRIEADSIVIRRAAAEDG
jgi:hypothetical protein